MSTAVQSADLPIPIRLKINFYRLLDTFGHWKRLSLKVAKFYPKYGAGWRDSERPGRRFVRTRYVADRGWFQLQTPGWEWVCPNCKEYSLITAKMMPGIIEEWRRNSENLRHRRFERNIQPMPIPSSVGCTNCCYRPGAPE